MSTTEVRTVSSTGAEKGVKPQRYSLLPKEALDIISEVYAFGAQKYADHNWRKGYEWSKSYDALMRHLTAFWSGETHDSESGLPHLAHAGFHVFAMLTWLSEQGEGGQFDDRYRSEPEIDWLAMMAPRMWLTGDAPTPTEPEFGDYVVIKRENGHQFPIGTRVALERREGGTARYVDIDGTGFWLTNDELEAVS